MGLICSFIGSGSVLPHCRLSADILMQCLPPKISQKVTGNERRRREYQGAERALMGVAGEGSGEGCAPSAVNFFDFTD